MNEFYENGILVTQVRALTNYNYVLIKSNQIKSDQIRSNQIKSNLIKSNQIKSNQIKSNQLDECLIIISKFIQNFIFLIHTTEFLLSLGHSTEIIAM